MTELITIIDEILKYGLEPNLIKKNKEKLLEKNLIKIYSLYFDIKLEFERADFPEFDKSKLPPIRENLESNFKDFGFYKTILDIGQTIIYYLMTSKTRSLSLKLAKASLRRVGIMIVL